MMKANELRVGNYVTGNQVKKGKFQDYILKETDLILVDSIIDLSEYGGKINNVHDSWEYDLKNIEPIQLTEGWLVKFGFDIKYSRIFIYDDDFTKIHLEKTDNHNTFGVFVSEDFYLKEIEHVHELQNLYFSLTGEELKIIN